MKLIAYIKGLKFVGYCRDIMMRMVIVRDGVKDLYILDQYSLQCFSLSRNCDFQLTNCVDDHHSELT